jgi:hypothetical protein
MVAQSASLGDFIDAQGRHGAMAEAKFSKRTRLTCVLGGAALGLWGCPSSSAHTPAPAPDGSASALDAGKSGAPVLDAGTAIADASTPKRDSGNPARPATISLGTLACPVDGGSCAPHQACCLSWSPNNSCASSFDACPCSNGTCPIEGCQVPADCPGQVCCAFIGHGQLLYSGCKASCDPLNGELKVCKTDTDCPGGGARCHNVYGSGYQMLECD